MEELSIEEKARYYDKAIAHTKKVLKIIGNATLGNLVLKNEFENMFPELAESEDEKIRKAIIEFFEYQDDNTTYSFIPKKDIIAWLEKQGEHANFLSEIQVGDKVTRNEDGVLVNLSQLNRVAKKQDEQNMHLPSFDEAQGTPIVKQDKSAEWSEEDENRFKNLIFLVECSNENEPTKKGFINFINRLKVLRSQNSWKPTSDQLTALFCAIPYIHCASTRACACSLYNDLKKLIKI